MHFRLDAEHVRAVEAVASSEDDAEGLDVGEIASSANVNGVARVAPASSLRAGEQARFEVAIDHLHLFDPDSGEALARPVRDTPGEVATLTGP